MQGGGGAPGSTMFSGWDEVEDYGARVYLQAPHSYLLKIESVSMFHARQKNCDGFGAEFEVVDSTCAEHPAGTRVNLTLLFDSPNKKAIRQREVRNFLAAGLSSFVDNVTFEGIDQQTVIRCASNEQPLAGRYIRVQVLKQKARNSGNMYTARQWSMWRGPDVEPMTLDVRPNEDSYAADAGYGMQQQQPYEQQQQGGFPSQQGGFGGPQGGFGGGFGG